MNSEKNENMYSKDDIIAILRDFTIKNEKDFSMPSVPFAYQNKDSDECVQLRSEWNIPSDCVINNNYSLPAIIKVMKWFNNRFIFDKSLIKSTGIEKLIEASSYKLIFEKLNNNEIPFTELFESLFFLYTVLSIGYKARLIKCMSLGFNNDGVYFVEAFVTDYDKWVVIDITNNIVFYIN